MIHLRVVSVAVAGAILFGTGFVGSVWAQDATKTAAQPAAPAKGMPALSVRIVDIDGVRAQSKAFIAAREQITAYSNKANQTLQKEDVALRSANEELNRKRTLLSPEAFADERKKFEQSVADFQRKRQEQQKGIDKMQLDAMGKINTKIAEIISQYAQANNVTLILPIQSVLLHADAMSIDAVVLDALNKELPSVTVTLPAQ